MSTPVTFLHFSDLHLRSETVLHPDAPLARLQAALAAARPLAPRFAVITGDLTDLGEDLCYRALRDALSAVDLPVLLCLGNHDARPDFRAVFAPGTPPESPWCHERTMAGLHVVALDTLVPGRSGGALSSATLAFLDAALAREPSVPKLVCLHHPPAMHAPPGWDSLDAASTAALAARLPGPVIGILAGHVHQDRASLWQGVPLFTSAGLHGVIDPAVPDVLRVVEGASWSLLRWSGATLTSTVVPVAPPRREIARVDRATLRV